VGWVDFVAREARACNVGRTSVWRDTLEVDWFVLWLIE